VYGNYFHAINVFEGGVGVRTQATAGLFATYAVRPYSSSILHPLFDKHKHKSSPTT
jgi:aquaglyceroporin related protein